MHWSGRDPHLRLSAGSVLAERGRGARGISSLSIPLIGLLGVTGALIAFLIFRNVESKAIEAEFRELARERLLHLREGLRLAETDMASLAAFPLDRGEWSDELFRKLALPWLSRNDGFRALEWSPRISSEDRGAFESKVQAAGHPDYRILEADAGGKLVVAGHRDVYFPIRFIQPEKENSQVLGFDLGFEPVRRSAVEQARDTGRATFSGQVAIPHVPGETGVLLILPVYRPGSPIETVEMRRTFLTGFYVAVLQPAVLSRSSRHDLLPIAIDLTLYDSADSGSPLAIDRFHPQSGMPPSLPAPLTAYSSGLQFTDSISFANRSWLAVYTPAAGYLASRRSLWPWFVLVLGLAGTTGAAGFVSFAQRHSVRLARLVDELARVNDSLQLSEQDLAITLHSIGDGVLVTDDERRILRMNPAAEKLTGWTQSDARNRHVEEVFRIINEESRLPAGLPIDEVLATGEIQGLANHTVLIARDGTEWAIADSAAPMRDSQGKLRGVVLVFRDVSEERHAARQIRELNENLENLVAERTSELRLAVATQLAVINSLPACIAMVDAQGTIVTVNEAWRQSDRADLLQRRDYGVGLNYVSLCEEIECSQQADDASKVAAGIRAILSGTDRIFEHEYRCRTTEEDRWFRLIVTPVTGESLHGAVITHLDQTERKSVELRHAWGSKILEAIATGAPLPHVLDLIVQGMQDFIPGAIASILLVDRDGAHLRHGAAPGLPEEYNRAVDGIAVGPSAGSCGTAAFRKQPVIVSDIATDPLWAGISENALRFGLQACWSVPVLDGQENVLSTFAVYYREARAPRATELQMIGRMANIVRISLERNRQQTELRESEERFRLLSRATNDTIWDWDLAANELWWSEGFEMLFGYRRDDLEPGIESWTNRIHPDDRERIVADVRSTIDGGGATWSAEHRYQRKNGSYAWVLNRGHVIRDDHGKPIRMIGGMTDETERKNLEAQLLQSQKMEAVGQLAGGIAHDFNNLLTIILGYSEVLMTMTPADSPAVSMLGGIQDAGERAANLTQQLLAFSRKQILAPRLLNLNAVIHDVEKMLRRLIGEDIEIVTHLLPALSQVRIDPGQLQQVIINLAINARDAMPTGGRLSISTTETEISEDAAAGLDCRPGRYVRLTIADNGCGMTPEIQSRIFEPFFTTKGHGKGTGLGLPTVFGIVKQSDGAIDVSSEVGAGTTFRILFPAIPGQAPVQTPVDPETRKGSETVLIVEDEESVRRIARLALEARGYRVLDAATGREALRLIESSPAPINLVITDVVMPEMSGRELADSLRRDYPAIKVMFMSGYTDDAVLRHGVTDAVDAFLQKPFRPLDLVRKVRDVFDE